MIDHSYNPMWAPDFVLESSGVACGDKISLYAIDVHGKIYFQYFMKSCNVSRRMADYLEKAFSGKDEAEIRNQLERLIKGDYNEKESWICEYIPNRQGCIEAPVSLLKALFFQNNACIVKHHSLDCDACVEMRRINWDIPASASIDAKKTVHNIYQDIYQAIRKEENMTESRLQKLGLAQLTDKEQLEFEQLMRSMTPTEIKKMKSLRLAALFLNNCYKYDISPNAAVVSLAHKQLVSMKVADKEIENVKNFINSNNLNIELVKGSRLNSLYPQGFLRTHMDYDFLAQNLNEAFLLIDYLINNCDYKLVLGGSVPFSFKLVEHRNKEIITGHIHLEKILQDQFQAVIDINMGGFPLGRTDVIQAVEQLSPEDLACITVAHLFKHDHAFIKDINDLYYMLRGNWLNKGILNQKIREYGLEFLFGKAVSFINDKFGLQDNGLNHIIKHPLCTITNNDWPFFRSSHFKVRMINLLLSSINQYGIINGITETKKQLLGISSQRVPAMFSSAFHYLNQRTYLFPVVFFSHYFDIDENKGVMRIGNYPIYTYDNIAILPIGIFLMHHNKNESIDRRQLEKNIDKVLGLIGITEEDCNYSYLMEARKDTWLY